MQWSAILAKFHQLKTAHTHSFTYVHANCPKTSVQFHTVM